MQTYTNDRATEQYLAQRIAAASQEQLLAMLLEGAQRFLALGVAALERKDVQSKTRYLHRTAEVVSELILWLDLEGGGELTQNMSRIYDWWMRELYEASRVNDSARLRAVGVQMGEIRSAVEEWLRKHHPEVPSPQPAPSPGIDGMMG